MDTWLLKDHTTSSSEENAKVLGSAALTGIGVVLDCILRPGRAVQVSLQDNRWLRDTALGLPRVRAVQEFLMNLLE
jgi:hypothetical protein